METKPQNYLLTGMFTDPEHVGLVYDTLLKKGYTKDEISLVMSQETRNKYFVEPEEIEGNKAAIGAATGSSVGAIVGAVAAVVALVGTSLIIPGIGLIVAGPLAAGLAGAGAGVVTGGIIGGLIGVGLPSERAHLYESGVNNGKIFIGIHPHSEEDADFFREDWKNKNAEDIYWEEDGVAQSTL